MAFLVLFICVRNILSSYVRAVDDDIVSDSYTL